MMKSAPIYVERMIHAPLDVLWDATQIPEQHQVWDLRFTEIQYLPKGAPDLPQQFLYTTRIGFGVAIFGKGESLGTRSSSVNGESTSALKFWSDDRLSLIQKGAGYWKYIPDDNHVKFLTWYDYHTRFGLLGRMMDWIFRPMLGWATALSFDCLGIWLEKGIHPRLSFERFAVQWTVRWTLCAIWIYQGLVPKMVFPDTGELQILRSVGVPSGQGLWILELMGVAEIGLGLLNIMVRDSRAFFSLQIIILGCLVTGAMLGQFSVLVAPFNPVTLTLSMVGLAVVGIVTMRDIPSASHCERKPSK